MQTSFKTTLFRTFDKIILVLIALWLLIAIGRVFLKPQTEQDRQAAQIPELIQQIQNKQKAATFQETTIDRDALGQVVRDFRTDYPVIPMPTGTMDPANRGIVEVIEITAEILINPKDPTSLTTRIPPDPRLDNTELHVKTAELISAERDRDGSIVVTAKPTAIGQTAHIEFTTGETLRGRIIINIKKADILIPQAWFTASSFQFNNGAASINWNAATRYCTLTEFRIYKSEVPAQPQLYLTIPLTEQAIALSTYVPPPPPPAPVTTQPGAATRPAAVAPQPPKPITIPSIRPDKTPGPLVIVTPSGFQLLDRDVIGGTSYSYRVEITAKAKDNELLTAATATTAIRVEEPFTIRVTSKLAPDTYKLAIEFTHTTPEGQTIRLVHSIQASPGQIIGWKMKDFYQDGKHYRDVDSSTGYILLDILNDEKAADGTTGQKLLLINQRGRIKELWLKRP